MEVETARKLRWRVKSQPKKVCHRKSHWSSWWVSLAFHVVVFLVPAWIWFPVSKGTGGPVDRPIGIALVHQSEGTTEFFDDAGAQGDNLANASSSSANAKVALEFLSSNPSPQSMKLDELLGPFAQVAQNSGGSLGSQDGTGEGAVGLNGIGDSGVGNGKGKGGSTSTSVFGIEGSGNSFLYVFDRSDSMNDFNGAPLRFAKYELTQSIRALTSVNQFQLVFYNDSANIYRGSASKTTQLIFATDVEKQSALSYVKAMTGAGGTEHVPALKLGTKLSPDVIFFLTDAADPSLTGSEVADIVERCHSRRTTIHAIEFGTGPSPGNDRWIEQLAKKTGGKYRYLDVTQFDR
jgi:hypothetical protein